MRPKKNPDIRRDQFIDAATMLFLQYGYEGVSIKAVLNAVDERTASPSVFYYYFSDKDELYHAAVENIAKSYLDGLEKVFADNSLSYDQQLTALIETMHMTLAANRKLDFSNLSDINRSFILDMKEYVTSSFSVMWEHFLSQSGLIKDGDARGPALFISGGISAMLMDYMTKGIRNEDAEQRLVKEIILFSAAVLGLDDVKKQQLFQSISNADSDSASRQVYEI